LWRAVVATTTASGRRNKGTWSYLGLGLFLGDFLGDIFAKYRTRLRERESSEVAVVAVVYGTCSVDMETLSLVCYPWRRITLLVLSCCCS
jgi:hypothetical protein